MENRFSLGEALLNLLFPPKCPFCRRLINRQSEMLCPRCKENLPWTQAHERRRGLYFSSCISPLRYGGDVRDALLRYKFYGAEGCAPNFGLLMAQCVRESGLNPDVVTWAPLSKRRLRERGFDQAGALARVVAKELNLPLTATLCKSHRPAQSSLESGTERLKNLRNAYSLKPGTDVTGKQLLLVDDIITTGATLDECARVLIEAGAAQVDCVTLAATPRHQTETTA